MRTRRDVDQRLNTLLAEAFEQGRCAAPDPRDTRTLRGRIQAGTVVEPYPQLFASAELWQRLSARDRSMFVMRALTECNPHLVFCGRSAALAHSLPVNEGPLLPLHVITPSKRPVRTTAHLQRHMKLNPEHAIRDGVRVTTLTQTVVDCGRTLPFSEALAVMDATLRMLDVERPMLDGFIDAHAPGYRGVRRAHKIATWADGRAESGGESIARAVMIEAGIAPSDLQVTFVDPMDPWRRPRVDFLFNLRDGSRVVGELDGMEKYVEPRYLNGRGTVDALVRERQRESHLTLLRMPIVRFTMRDVWTPGRLVAMLAQAGVTAETLTGHDYRATAPRPDLPYGSRSWTTPAPPIEL